MRRIAVLLLLAAAVAVPAARADGDPASDYLLGQQTFVPPDTGISSSDAKQLAALVAGARRGGYAIRVAIIASRYDLGSVTALYEQPARYAHFLSIELKFVYTKRVLVVMPNGYGVARNGLPSPAEQKVLDRLPPPTATHGPGLAGSAARAVRALAANAGVHIVAAPIVKERASGDSTTRDRILIACGAAVLLALAAAYSFFRRRRRAATTAR
ncbi:MAG: hypothetical protein ACRDM1_08545 [Gaiellaceae bacterium]